ncbi:hypothetical protein ACFOY2_41390 [Nonomuraea purpurea]|uniref:Transposase IS701-like DDE domain-containing protein n=1 Tax=Nonomuraea purpurea TaxID=1849276 RepID=A0ABV8GNH9_9ACTN
MREPELLERKFSELTSAIAGAFGRVEPRKAATGYLRGLLSEMPRKTCWDLGKHAGYQTPDVMQRLLARAAWDEDTRFAATWSLIWPARRRYWCRMRPARRRRAP